MGIPTSASIADWWLDGVLTDWITLRRLPLARERVGQILEAVRAIELRLLQARATVEHALARERRKLEEHLRP